MTEPAAVAPAGRPAFAHASEAELARILDFYEVRWAYEPDTFPIGWNLDGEVVESFSPDFYLPDLELYVELTTLKQKLVRKKNRKLRRLRELYPNLQIKLFYARDFRMLLLKFGRLALIDELTGTTGQATPARTDVDREDPAPAPSDPAASPAGEVAAPPAPDPAAAGPAQPDAAAPSEGRGRRRGRRRRRSASGEPAGSRAERAVATPAEPGGR